MEAKLKILILYLSLISPFTFAQKVLHKDTIVPFSIELTIRYAPRLDIESFTIDNIGNVRHTYLTNRGQIWDTIADQRMNLNKKSFRQFKESVVDLELWRLPEKLDAPDISDGSLYELKLFYIKTLIVLSGQNREQVEKPFKGLLVLLNKVMGNNGE